MTEKMTGTQGKDSLGIREKWAINREDELKALTGKSSFAELYQAMLEERVAKLQEILQERGERQLEQERIDAKLNGVEVIRRIMPDGTIRVTKYAGNEILKTMTFQPQMMAVPDTTKEIPRAEDGTRLTSKQAMTFRPRVSVLETEFL